MRHLIPDDQARLQLILNWPLTWPVADVGSSDGAIVDRLEEQWGAHIDRYDVRPRTPTTQFYDLRQGPLPRQYATILCCEVLEHVTAGEAVTAFTYLQQSLLPKGRLYVLVPNMFCDTVYVAGCRDRWRWPDHRSAWDKRTLEETFGPPAHWIGCPVEIDPKDAIWIGGVWIAP